MTSTQKIQEVTTQLHATLLQKELLAEQLQQVTERIKALRNVLMGIQLGRESMQEDTKVDCSDCPVDNGSVD